MVFSLTRLLSERQIHLEGTKYSLPVNWAMTGLFWLWFMAFVIYHVGWILAIMKCSLCLVGTEFSGGSQAHCSSIKATPSLACCCSGTKESLNPSGKVSLKESLASLVVLGEWVHLYCSLRRRLWPCAWYFDMERAGGRSQLSSTGDSFWTLRTKGKLLVMYGLLTC